MPQKWCNPQQPNCTPDVNPLLPWLSWSARLQSEQKVPPGKGGPVATTPLIATRILVGLESEFRWDSPAFGGRGLLPVSDLRLAFEVTSDAVVTCRYRVQS